MQKSPRRLAETLLFSRISLSKHALKIKNISCEQSASRWPSDLATFKIPTRISSITDRKGVDPAHVVVKYQPMLRWQIKKLAAQQAVQISRWPYLGKQIFLFSSGCNLNSATFEMFSSDAVFWGKVHDPKSQSPDSFVLRPRQWRWLHAQRNIFDHSIKHFDFLHAVYYVMASCASFDNTVHTGWSPEQVWKRCSCRASVQYRGSSNIEIVIIIRKE